MDSWIDSWGRGSMNTKVKNRPATVAEVRERFVYFILAMMLVAGSTDWLAHF